MDLNVIDEQYPGKVVGVYNDEPTAKQIAEQLSRDCGFLAEQLNVVSPEDTQFQEKVEPDSKGVGRTLFKSHFILGSVGGIAGLLIAGLLIFIGPAFAASSPVVMLCAMTMMGAFFGLLVAGVISLRPDHDKAILSSIDATHNEQWSVIVQTKDRNEIEQAKEVMQPLAVKLSESF